MTAPAIRVSAEWLALREPADAAARAGDLVEHMRRQLPHAGRWVIHDLGCGTGAMGRWLAPLLPGPQHWVRARPGRGSAGDRRRPPPGPAADGAAVTLEAKHSDITRLHPGDLAGATLITASALLDLLTEDELAGLVALVRRTPGCPMLLTLSVVGRVELIPGGSAGSPRGCRLRRPPTPRDRAGPSARPGRRCAGWRGVRPTGAEVLVRPSPWRLGAAQAGLAAEWFIGWVGAACEQEVELAAEAELYIRRRLAQAAAGELAVTVDHADLLVLPR